MLQLRPTALLLPLAGAGLVACGSSSSKPAPVAPVSLAYGSESLRIPSQVFLPELTPSIEGGTPTTFSIAPALPAGLTLGDDGVIRGVPTGVLAETLFEITGSNTAGSVSTELRLEVEASFDEPRFLYVSNYDDHTLSTFVLTPDGELRHHGYTAADPNPGALAAAPNGHHIYSAHPADSLISVFRSEPATGRIERVDQVAALMGTTDLVLDERGEWLFAAHTAGIATYRAGGADSLELAANTGADEAVALALHPDGHTLYAALFSGDAIGVYSVDPNTGALAIQELQSAGTEPAAVLLHPNGEVLYAAHSGSGKVGVYAVDATSGQLTLSKTLGAGTQPADLALDADAETLFVVDLGGEALLTFEVDGAGQLSSRKSLPAPDAPLALELDAAGDGVFMTHLDTSDVSHWTPAGATMAQQTRVRSRGGATDALLVKGPTALSIESTLAFTANRDFGDLSTLSLDGQTGELTDVGQPVAAGGDPLALSFDVSGGRLYAATENGDLAPFALESETLADSSMPVLAAGEVTALAVDPSGRFVFSVGSGGLESFAIDAAGDLTASDVLPTGSDPAAVVAEPGGLYLYVLNRGSRDVSGYWVHGVTGRLEELDDSPWGLAPNADPSALAVHPSGRFLYVANENNDTVSGYSIGVEGDLTPHLHKKVVNSPSHVALSPDGRWMFATSFVRSEITLCEIDPLEGDVTSREVQGGLSGPSSVHVDATGRYAYIADSAADRVSVFGFDAGSGELEKVQDLDLGAGAAPSAVVTDWRLVEGQ